jgi:hypothetical protein
MAVGESILNGSIIFPTYQLLCFFQQFRFRSISGLKFPPPGMPTDHFRGIYLPPVVYLAQPKHRILANASRTAQEVMNLGWAIYPLSQTNNAA